MSEIPMERTTARQFFDEAADRYDQYAVLQREIGSRLFERVDFRRYEPAVVLDLGCATATASRSLAGQFPEASVIALDWSIAMLKQGRASGLSGLCADMHTLPLAPASVDLVFSNLAISWGRDVPAVFTELRRVMKPRAMLVFTCFGPGTLFELRAACRKLSPPSIMYNFPDMHNVGDELIRTGFREPVMDAEHLVLEYPDVHSLLHELGATGVSIIGGGNLHDMGGSAGSMNLAEAYEPFQNGNRIPAKFEVIYGTAFAPDEGQPVKTAEGDVATFSVKALRSKSRNRP